MKIFKNIGRFILSIPLSIASYLLFYFAFFITAVILGLIFMLISHIPIVSNLSDWFMRSSENDPLTFTQTFSITIGGALVYWLSKLILKNSKKRGFTLINSGILLSLSNFVAFIINIMENERTYANEVVIIAGIVLIAKGWNACACGD